MDVRGRRRPVRRELRGLQVVWVWAAGTSSTYVASVRRVYIHSVQAVA